MMQASGWKWQSPFGGGESKWLQIFHTNIKGNGRMATQFWGGRNATREFYPAELSFTYKVHRQKIMHLCPNAGAELFSWAIFFFLKIKLLATKSDQQREKCRHCKERSIDEHKIPFLLESEWLLPYPRYSVFSLRLLLLSEIFLFVRTETFLLDIVSPASGRPPGRADPLRNTDRIDENTAPYLH